MRINPVAVPQARCVALLVFVLAFTAGTVAHSAPNSARLIIEAQYFADSRSGDQGLVHGAYPIQRPIHPFRKLAARLMSYAGVRLTDNGETILHIEAKGLALGSLYDFMENRMRLRHLRFAGATIEGRVSLTTHQDGMTCTAQFTGTIPTLKGAMIVGAWDYRESPQRAPFDAAVAEPGSFIDSLAALMAVVYGPSPLTAARADPNDAIARASRNALEGRPDFDCVTP